ncbi:MAG: DUF3810 domain-containing protein [Clostridiales bacterium]|nr:DUF3810 domain-containing protein [Clostridiales bacterium]
MEKLKNTIKTYCPIVSLVLFIFAILSVIIHIISELSVPFSDFFNRYISSFFRGLMAMITNLIPFSVAECIIISLPVICIILIVLCVKRVRRSMRDAVRYLVSLASVVALMYSMFVMTTSVAYNGSTLAAKLGLNRQPVSVEQLRVTAEYMIEKMNAELGEVEFRYGGSSVMPYSVSEMNDKLLEAYDKLSEKYSFIPRLWSRVKQVSLSEAMTYTHMSGMYTYYTGEANLNVNFPDYNLPFTAAHELAHQRGVLPENEANFVAFLVCCESDDPYIRYSGYMNMYEYLNSALYSADYDTFAEVYNSLDMRAIYEMRAYNAFFEKYRENVAANVSSTLNDTYLKAQGQTAGEKSYGMVVDLAVAYVIDERGD